jgi:endo-1,4-beta-xylanase
MPLLPLPPDRPSRRAVLAGGVALAACGGGQGVPVCPDIVLKRDAAVTVGTCLNADDLEDPALARLAARQFAQVTPGWEMKMSAIVGDDGAFRFTAADRVAAFAAAHGLALHGHALVWYKHQPAAFTRLIDRPDAFADLYRRFIDTTVRRYPARGWDVVNEPVAHTGTALRDSLWSRVMGPEDYMLAAFAAAREAAGPDVPLFLNDYGLEAADKRGAFLALAERLIRRGAPIGGLGTQSHLDVDLPAGAVGAAIRDLARLGLPVHVSELDVSFGHRRFDWRSAARKRHIQARLAGEAAEAFVTLPSRQRYAFTLWGMRDRESWLRQPPFEGGDQPLAFDDAGAPKPMACALNAALHARGGGPRRIG